MTREECAAAVQGPGKFEGEPIYSPYFWDMVLNGFAEEETTDDDSPVAGFHVCDADRELFPELGDTTRVVIWEDDNGFVYCRTISEQAYAEELHG